MERSMLAPAEPVDPAAAYPYLITLGRPPRTAA